ncbi:MAG TPA: DUF1302 family protein [Candidatus Binatia bacterium]
MRRGARALGLALALLLVAGRAPVRASPGPDAVTLEPWGNAQTQEVLRHPDVDEWHFVQQRNTVRLGARGRLDVLTDAAWLPRLDDASFTLLYRGVYDAIYDVAPTLRERDLRGRKPGRAAARDLHDLPRRARDALRFESDLRAAFVDLRARRLRLRLGKQQLAWGEADFLRMLDRANPLDTSWHSVEELPPPSFGWDDLRIPLWMADADLALGDAGRLRDLHLEAYWNPGDWRPMKVGYLPRPWGVRLLDPLTNREDGAFVAPFAGVERLDHSSLFRQGHYRRTPAENSQVGVRLAATLPHEVRAGVYWFRQRWAGDDGTPVAILRGIPDTPAGRQRTNELLSRGTLPVSYIAPFIQTVGMSSSAFFPPLAATVRLETVYDFALPMLDRSATTTLAPFVPGLTHRDYWKGVLAFDRPFTIDALNPGGAVFVTAQAFVHHLMHDSDTLAGPLDLPTAGARGRPYCGSPPDRPCPDPNGNGSFRDDVRSWEALLTVAAFSSYAAGRLQPVAGVVLDPVNSWSLNAFWSLCWVAGPRVSVDLTQRYFATAQRDVQKGPFDPWMIGTMRGRSETGLRVTYAF